MHRRVAALIAALSILVGWTAGDISAGLLSAQAMACCARAHYDCAGFQAPDDCCKTLRHGTQASATSPTVHVTLAPPAFVPELVGMPDSITFARPARTFARLHDPPHLHTFSLLI